MTMFKIMKFLIFLILIYVFDFLLGFLIFDHFATESIMTMFMSTMIATVLAIITTYYLIKLIDNMLGI